MTRKARSAPTKKGCDKQRRRGPIYSLPKAALCKLQRLCESDTPYREAAEWLQRTFGFHVSDKIVHNWWKQKRTELAQKDRSNKATLLAGGFKIVVDAPGARHVDVEVLPVRTSLS
jgi:hypothetical protein